MTTLSPIIDMGQAGTALAAYLMARNYSAWSRRNILAHVERAGELAGAVALGLLDAEDEAEATEIFVANLPAEPMCHRDWDDESVILDVELLIQGAHPWPIPTLGPEDDDAREFPPPSIEPEPYDPTAEDEADYLAWLADREARPDRHSVESLQSIHRLLYGRSEPFHA